MDLWLWISEEIETRDWDSAAVGTRLGLAINFVFLVARANLPADAYEDDIFAESSTTGWFNYLVRWTHPSHASQS